LNALPRFSNHHRHQLICSGFGEARYRGDCGKASSGSTDYLPTSQGACDLGTITRGGRSTNGRYYLRRPPWLFGEKVRAAAAGGTAGNHSTKFARDDEKHPLKPATCGRGVRSGLFFTAAKIPTGISLECNLPIQTEGEIDPGTKYQTEIRKYSF